MKQETVRKQQYIFTCFCPMIIWPAETKGEQGAENRHRIGRAGLPGSIQFTVLDKNSERFWI